MIMLTKAPRAQQLGARRRYATAQALAHAHSTNPLLWRRERRRSELVPNQLIIDALECRPVSRGLAALAGSRGLAFEFWDRLRTRPDAGGDIAVSFLEGALETASQLQSNLLALGVQELDWRASMLRRAPRWHAALDRFIARDHATIRSWGTSKKGLITQLSRASATRKGRLFLALVSLAQREEEPNTVRILSLQALDAVYKLAPAALIHEMPIELLREAYPRETSAFTAQILLSRPEVLSDCPWVLQILDGQVHREELLADLPTLALRAYSGGQALAVARDLFAQVVQPSKDATISFTTALRFRDSNLRKMLTPAIVVACLSVEPRAEARDYLLQELARLS
jgi:hypothetical protein